MQLNLTAYTKRVYNNQFNAESRSSSNNYDDNNEDNNNKAFKS